MSIGALFLHGFSGGPYEVQPFVDYVQQRTDWVIAIPTLSGHGEAEDLAMKGYKAHHWLMDAEIAYRRLARQVDEVIIVGFSMGGVIAMYLASRYKVKKLVLLSAAAKYISPSQLVKDFRFIATDAMANKLQENELFARYKFKFQNVPFSATVEFMKIVRKTTPYFKNIMCPTFIVQGLLDGIVPSQTAQLLYDQIQSNEKRMYFSESGKHHICFSEDCDDWFDEVLTFIKRGNNNQII